MLILSVLNLIPNRLSPNSRFIRTSETLEGIKRASEEREILISSVKYMIFFPTSFTKEKVWKLGYESILGAIFFFLLFAKSTARSGT